MNFYRNKLKIVLAILGACQISHSSPDLEIVGVALGDDRVSLECSINSDVELKLYSPESAKGLLSYNVYFLTKSGARIRMRVHPKNPPSGRTKLITVMPDSPFLFGIELKKGQIGFIDRVGDAEVSAVVVEINIVEDEDDPVWSGNVLSKPYLKNFDVSKLIEGIIW
jgi:hypothetical protein